MNEKKIQVFQREIHYIRSERYRENMKKLVSYLPDYFLRFQRVRQENIILVMH